MNRSAVFSGTAFQVGEDAVDDDVVIGSRDIVSHALDPHGIRIRDYAGAFLTMFKGDEGIGTAVQHQRWDI